ncbi:phosphotransferase [Altererythrobacter arenosus]|uniref:Phosphotransferase n=1 Tax=Altererythrobacter arenosus TaxID=3032592 RepID=A0ABY8FVT4_9SPHN|nr:phosphotransferase [Altererythrobacter sp. CAU 1644]WFL78340.1 phosphotransferase [Altererythrobacter sp. CAU 1644]
MSGGEPNAIEQGLARALARVGLSPPSGLTRLTGGATMESWRFSSNGEDFVLRRSPSLAFMQGRPYGHATEAALIEAARAAGVTAPEVVTVLEEGDGIGSGFIMCALPGTPNPKEILAMDGAQTILREAARDLARIHSLSREDVPADVPVMDYRAAIADLRQQFEEAGGDRPIIALGLKWMEDNCPEECAPVLNHGDYRMGNILAENGHLTGVLDWELAHFGDPHEDLAFGCMAVWRFARYDRPALGLGPLEDYFATYEAESGRTVDRARFRYWTIHRTVWWALGCLKCAKTWREGADRTLERVVISRRTSEQELDLLMLLEEDAPEEERARQIKLYNHPKRKVGEAAIHDLAAAIAEWLHSIKDSVQGHDRFQLAVARNALGIIERDDLHGSWQANFNSYATDGIFEGGLDLSTKDHLFLAKLYALEKVAVDSPKYPALAVARKKWTGED